jgi:hypothetical protein
MDKMTLADTKFGDLVSIDGDTYMVTGGPYTEDSPTRLVIKFMGEEGISFTELPASTEARPLGLAHFKEDTNV